MCNSVVKWKRGWSAQFSNQVNELASLPGQVTFSDDNNGKLLHNDASPAMHRQTESLPGFQTSHLADSRDVRCEQENKRPWSKSILFERGGVFTPFKWKLSSTSPSIPQLPGTTKQLQNKATKCIIGSSKVAEVAPVSLCFFRYEIKVGLFFYWRLVAVEGTATVSALTLH